MTADEADELVHDLERAGVQVETVEPLEPRAYYQDRSEWQIRCWCPDPTHLYVITNARFIREAVHARLLPNLPPSAPDR
jgi:hypothetical protein